MRRVLDALGTHKISISPSRSGAIAAWLAVLLILASIPAVWDGDPVASNALGAQTAAVPSYSPSDALLAPARGTVEQILNHAQKFGSLRMADVEAYVTEVYNLAPLVGLDPAVVVSQSNLETDTWRTAYWSNHLNPAGIGITSDGAASFTWKNGTEAARGQIVHLYVYAVGVIPRGHVLEPYIPLDPRYDAAIQAGFAGIADTVDDLTGRWAVDPNYGEKLAGRGNDMFVRQRIGAYAQSTGSSSSALADDGKPTTAWATVTNPPPDPSYAWYDLGSIVSIGSIRWVFAQTGLADQYEVQLSTNGSNWTTLGTFTNVAANSWVNLETNASGRYLRFVFHNPNGDTKLGGLGEIQLWPPTTAPLPWLPAASAPPPWTPGAGAPKPTPTAVPSGPLAVTLSVTRGTVNTWLGVTVTGFSSGQLIDIQWKGVTRAQVTANQNGSGYVRMRVPAAPIGTYTVRAVSGSRSVSASYTIAPRVKVIPSSASRGETVDVSLRGFGKKETVRIRWIRDGKFEEITTVLTSNTGSANVDVAVPSWVPDGPTSVRGDGPVARAQTNAFVVEGGDLTSAEEGTPTATATETATPSTDGTPIGTETETPTATVEVPTETPLVETATPEPTATETPTAELTPTDTPPGTPVDEVPLRGHGNAGVHGGDVGKVLVEGVTPRRWRSGPGPGPGRCGSGCPRRSGIRSRPARSGAAARRP